MVEFVTESPSHTLANDTYHKHINKLDIQQRSIIEARCSKNRAPSERECLIESLNQLHEMRRVLLSRGSAPGEIHKLSRHQTSKDTSSITCELSSNGSCAHVLDCFDRFGLRATRSVRAWYSGFWNRLSISISVSVLFRSMRHSIHLETQA